jgi:hypothetical protein
MSMRLAREPDKRDARERRSHYIGAKTPQGFGAKPMCRNIKTLFNFDPVASDEEIRAASLQFVRKLSGFNAPSKANEAAFALAVEEVFQSARKLIDDLETNAPPKDREIEAQKARERNAVRFGKPAEA